MDSDYSQRRRDIEHYFRRSGLEKSQRETIESPSGNYVLTIDSYITGPNSWKYTRGVVLRVGSRTVIADIKRNYSHFWHSWVQHANGNEYLLCGEDYQGQTVVNLTAGTVEHFFPDSGFAGFGFCWTAAYPSSDSEIIAVDGCYWACPYEVVFFDFSRPDELPYREYFRVGDLVDCEGWQEDGRFRLRREVEVRKSDGRAYEDLTDDEQDELDNGDGLSEYVTQDVIVTREQIIGPHP